MLYIQRSKDLGRGADLRCNAPLRLRKFAARPRVGADLKLLFGAAPLNARG